MPGGRTGRGAGLPAFALILALGLVACAGDPGESGGADPEPRPCPGEVEAGKDSAPRKAVLEHARGFAVDYHPTHKLVRTKDPVTGAETPFVLDRCGAPPPLAPAGATVITLPVRTLATTSTTELPHVLALGLEERLVGHDELDFIVSPRLRRRAEAGFLTEIGAGERLDLERILALAPELLLVDSPTRLGAERAERLGRAGVAVVAVPSYLESTPLGRAEWVKFMALFFDLEAEAEEVFAGVARRYGELKALAAAVEHRPTVLTSLPLSGTWYVPGGRSFLAQLLRDAGASYLWAEDDSVGSLHLDLEVVLERGAGAEVWLHPSDLRSLAEIRANDPRLSRLRAFAEGRVYGNDARLSPGGGNDYWELGSARPDLVLEDLIAIFHPQLLPGHRLTFHRRLEED